MAGELAYFELGVEDVERGRAFYAALFGWTVEPGPSGGYSLGTPNVPGGIHGGDRAATPYVFLRVDDMDAALERVRELGGTVTDADLDGGGGGKGGNGGEVDAEKTARFGRFVLCTDDQGSAFGLHQPPG